jgi:hypothetical protein
VNEALLFIFRKDREFKAWLTANNKDVDLNPTDLDKR